MISAFAASVIAILVLMPAIAVALNIQLPGWVEERRFLALELVAGSMIGVHGMIGKPLKKARRKKRR